MQHPLLNKRSTGGHWKGQQRLPGVACGEWRQWLIDLKKDPALRTLTFDEIDELGTFEHFKDAYLGEMSLALGWHFLETLTLTDQISQAKLRSIIITTCLNYALAHHPAGDYVTYNRIQEAIFNTPSQCKTNTDLQPNVETVDHPDSQIVYDLATEVLQGKTNPLRIYEVTKSWLTTMPKGALVADCLENDLLQSLFVTGFHVLPVYTDWVQYNVQKRSFLQELRVQAEDYV